MEQETKQEVPAITVEQFNELKAQLQTLTDTNVSLSESNDKLEGNNKTLVSEKRAEVSKAADAKRSQLEADGKHKELYDDARSVWDSKETEWNAERADLSATNRGLQEQLYGRDAESTLKAVFTQIGMNPTLAQSAEDIFRHNWTFDDKGGVVHNGTSLQESITAWSASDAGKPYLVSNNSGSGASPSTSTSGANVSTQSLSFDERLKAIQSGKDINK